MAEPVQQYLQRYAEPEAREVSVSGLWDRAVVVPLRDETTDFLDGLRALAGHGRLLVIAIVNGVRGMADRIERANARLLQDLVGRELTGLATLVEGPEHDRLVLDRSRGERAFAAGQGVGLARKIGLDLAVSLWHRGQLRCPWLRTTDADATLRCVTEDDAPMPGASARIAPFWHLPSGDRDVDRATARYEVWLRYYVAGLAHAGSPWAMPTIGSTLEVSATSYAVVRGMPRREAGEDFHILAKLAKVGAVEHGGGVAVDLLSRTSQRVPFGTGPAVARAVEKGVEPTAYDPVIFDELRRFLQSFDELTRTDEDVGRLGLGAAAVEVLRDLGLPSALTDVRRRPGPAARTRRLHEWFDARRTLRFVHGLRDRAHADLPWFEALAAARFVPRGQVDRKDDHLIPLRTTLAGLAPRRAGLGRR